MKNTISLSYKKTNFLKHNFSFKNYSSMTKNPNSSFNLYCNSHSKSLYTKNSKRNFSTVRDSTYTTLANSTISGNTASFKEYLVSYLNPDYVSKPTIVSIFFKYLEF